MNYLKLFGPLLLLCLTACSLTQPANVPIPEATATAAPTEIAVVEEVADEPVLSAEEIETIVVALRNYPAIASVVVRYQDEIVFEHYGENQSAEKIVEIYSVTKSVTSLLAGIALHTGDLEGLDLLVADLLPGYMADADPRLQPMTVEHIMTMTSGLRSSWELEGTPINAYRGDLHATSLELGYANDPGTTAFYNTQAANLMGGVLEAATGEDLETYAATHLFEPLGITDWSWYRDDEERVTTGAGLLMRPADLTKLGQLVLNEGMWGGERLISAEYITTATSPIVDAPHWGDPTEGYGYLWWVPDDLGDQPTIVGYGYAGQILYILPESDLVVSMSAPCCFGGWRQLELVNDTILPAIQGDEGAAQGSESAAACTESVGQQLEIELASDSYDTVPVNVYLPPCYESNISYPVVYMLHGGGLDQDSWFDIGAPDSADSLISEGKIAPLILVSPSIPKFFNSDSYGDFLLNQLVPHIDTTYRVNVSCAENVQALMGMSLGGGMTAAIGFKHPAEFDALAILSIASIFQKEQQLEGLLDSINEADMPAIYLDVGADDGLVPQTQALHELLSDRSIAHENHLRPGDHTLSYWTRIMPEYLEWLNSVFLSQDGC